MGSFPIPQISHFERRVTTHLKAENPEKIRIVSPLSVTGLLVVVASVKHFLTEKARKIGILVVRRHLYFLT